MRSSNASMLAGIGTSSTLPLALVAILFAGSTWAATPTGSSPMQVLKDSNDKVAKLIEKKTTPGSDAEKKQDEKLKKVIDKLLDFPALAKSALGKHWKDLSLEQQNEVTRLLTELIQRNYIKQIHDRKDEKYIVTYDSETLDGDDKAVVVTTVTAEARHDEQTQVTYKMKKKGVKWVVVDIETDGVSLVQNYRSQFSKIIEKEGADKLIEKMKKKVESGEEGGL